MIKNLVIIYITHNLKISLVIWTGGIPGDMKIPEIVKAMKNEIKANGTITAAIDVYTDFYHYGEGVYKVI